MLKRFIEDCMDLIQQARNQGATMKQVHEIFVDAGVPIRFSTFKSYYTELTAPPF